MIKIVTSIQRNMSQISLVAILIAALAMRAWNLNYNSPFNDEAIYIVLGRLGIFQGDWWTYNAASWMAGQPFIYPPLSAIAYMTAGIVGSRFLNVIIGVLSVEAMFAWTLLQARGEQGERLLAGLVSAVIMSCLGVALYVSRLATYDMLSFYFMIMACIFLLKAEQNDVRYGKWYMLAAVLLFLAFMTKVIIGAYIPLIVLYSFVRLRTLDVQRSYWLKYFFVPLALGVMGYSLLNFSSLMTYGQSQVHREFVDGKIILQTYWRNIWSVWLLWVVGSIGMLLKRQWRTWLVLSLASLVILGVHVATHRLSTLDKHTLLSAIFLMPIIGMGISHLVFYVKNKWFRGVCIMVLSGCLVVYGVLSYHDAARFNREWHNSNSVLSYLTQHAAPGDHVLAEVGAGAILATYDKDYPPNTVTFDWFQYRNLEGDEAYIAAVKDGYFRLIELDGGDATSEQFHSGLHNYVLQNLGPNYQQVFNQQSFVVYERKY